MSQEEESSQRHTISCHTDNFNDLSLDQLRSEIHQIHKAYQNMKQERDMLLKSLHVHHRRIISPPYGLIEDVAR